MDISKEQRPTVLAHEIFSKDCFIDLDYLNSGHFEKITIAGNISHIRRLVVITEDFQWLFIRVDRVSEIKALQEEWEVTYYDDRSIKNTIAGLIKILY